MVHRGGIEFSCMPLRSYSTGSWQQAKTDLVPASTSICPAGRENSTPNPLLPSRSRTAGWGTIELAAVFRTATFQCTHQCTQRLERKVPAEAVRVVNQLAERCRTISNADRPNPADKDLAISSIAIPDQVTRSLLPAASLSELISDPFGRRVRGYPKPQDLPQTMAS